MNCGNTYYFIDDYNDICKCKYGVQKEFSEKIELLDLIDDINEIIDGNEQLKKQIEWCRSKLNTLLTKTNELNDENEQLKQFKNIARDYNIPFEKLCDSFEECLDENEQLKQEVKRLKGAMQEYEEILKGDVE